MSLLSQMFWNWGHFPSRLHVDNSSPGLGPGWFRWSDWGNQDRSWESILQPTPSDLWNSQSIWRVSEGWPSVLTFSVLSNPNKVYTLHQCLESLNCLFLTKSYLLVPLIYARLGIGVTIKFSYGLKTLSRYLNLQMSFCDGTEVNLVFWTFKFDKLVIFFLTKYFIVTINCLVLLIPQ